MLLALCLMLGIAALAEADDPVAVRVGEYAYSQSTVQKSLDSDLELSQMLQGDAPGSEEKQARLEAAIDSFVTLGVIENKLAEAGKNDFTAAELEALDQSARSKYEELWQLMRQQLAQQDTSVDEETVTARLEGMGYTYDAIYDEMVLQTRQNRALEMFCADVVLTQSQVDEYYEEQFLAPDREAYEGNIDRYDQEILMNENEAFYTPEGYRYIRQIVLEFPKEALNAAASAQVRYNRAASAVSVVLQKLTSAAIEAEDWSDALAEAKAAYDEAAAALEQAQVAYADALEAATLPLLADKIDEINAAFAAGIDFKSLVNRYSTDRTERNISGLGYPFHPDSEMWPEKFRAAAAALEKPGDISDPVVTEQGVHIIYYDSDMPAGDHVPTEEEQKLLNAAALRYYQLERLNALVEDWKQDYDIETHPELIKY